jgi:hypothetical protein
MAVATARRRTGSDSNRNLSKYSSLVVPERKVNVPARWHTP